MLTYYVDVCSLEIVYLNMKIESTNYMTIEKSSTKAHDNHPSTKL